MITSIETIIFQRKQNSEYEQGILLNEGVLGIIDKDGKTVKGVWYFRTYPGVALHDLSIGKEVLTKKRRSNSDIKAIDKKKVSLKNSRGLRKVK